MFKLIMQKVQSQSSNCLYSTIQQIIINSKIYEKLILGQLWKIADENNVDLTGEKQHGFKKDKSTVTAALHLQSLISRALDSNNFYVLSSLDLSSAFDIVNRDLWKTFLGFLIYLINFNFT